jgi:plastocyanin
MLAGLALLGAMPATAAEIKVTIRDMMFEPAALRARVGDTLVIENTDDTAHQVFVATRGHSIDLGGQKKGEVRRYTVRQAGTFDLECVPHGHMSAKVEVTP